MQETIGSDIETEESSMPTPPSGLYAALVILFK
jgi:hypothetical protein